MPKKIIPLADYVSASVAASILSDKLGRPVSSRYIYRLKNVRSVKMNETTRLYNRIDIQNSKIRERRKQE